MSISYAIGKAEPTAVEIDTFGTARVDEDVIRLAVLDVFDLRPAAIMSLLHLRAPIYADTGRLRTLQRLQVQLGEPRQD